MAQGTKIILLIFFCLIENMRTGNAVGDISPSDACKGGCGIAKSHCLEKCNERYASESTYLSICKEGCTYAGSLVCQERCTQWYPSTQHSVPKN